MPPYRTHATHMSRSEIREITSTELDMDANVPSLFGMGKLDGWNLVGVRWRLRLECHGTKVGR